MQHAIFFHIFQLDQLKGLAQRSDSLASKQKEELMLARRRVDEMSTELTKLKAQVSFFKCIC